MASEPPRHLAAEEPSADSILRRGRAIAISVVRQPFHRRPHKSYEEIDVAGDYSSHDHFLASDGTRRRMVLESAEESAQPRTARLADQTGGRDRFRSEAHDDGHLEGGFVGDQLCVPQNRVSARSLPERSAAEERFELRLGVQLYQGQQTFDAL